MHYVNVFMRKVKDAIDDGVYHEKIERLRDDLVGAIERDKEGALSAEKRQLQELRREAGELRLEVSKLSDLVMELRVRLGEA